MLGESRELGDIACWKSADLAQRETLRLFNGFFRLRSQIIWLLFLAGLNEDNSMIQFHKNVHTKTDSKHTWSE